MLPSCRYQQQPLHVHTDKVIGSGREEFYVEHERVCIDAGSIACSLFLLVHRASEQLDLELGSHHGSQQGSAAASSFEGQELDEDEAAAAADFTPMTEEKRLFVNEWIAKLGEGLPDEQDPVEVTLLQYSDGPMWPALSCQMLVMHADCS